MKVKLTTLTLLITFFLFLVNIERVGAVIYPCISDVYIDEYAPDENMNFRTRILISYHPSKGVARGLFKFDIAEEIEAFQITAATLYLSSSHHTGGGAAIDVKCYALNEPFNEGIDTWNSLSGGNFDGSVASAGSLPSGNDWAASLDVTAIAIGNLEKLRVNGLLMRLQIEGPLSAYQNIASRECIDPGDFAPYLDIEYSGISSSSTTSEPVETSTTSSLVTSTTSSIDNPLTTTSSINVSSTTTTIKDDTTTIITSSTTTGRKPPCLVETIYGVNSEEAMILRCCRDHILQSTPEGRELVQLYYAWSPFIVRMIEIDPELQYEFRETLDELLHIILND